jgi:hypothetical protein
VFCYNLVYTRTKYNSTVPTASSEVVKNDLGNGLFVTCRYVMLPRIFTISRSYLASRLQRLCRVPWFVLVWHLDPVRSLPLLASPSALWPVDTRTSTRTSAASRLMAAAINMFRVCHDLWIMEANRPRHTTSRVYRASMEESTEESACRAAWSTSL